MAEPESNQLDTAAPTPYAPGEPGQVVIYRGATLIDGTDAPARTGFAVVTDGSTIAAVLPDADLPSTRWPGAEMVDLTGRFLLPGLIDTHQHYATPPNRSRAEAELRRQAYSGITAVRDMADDLRQIADLARSTLVGEIPGPDICFAALMAGPTFFDDPRTQAVSKGLTAGRVPWMQAVDSGTDLRLAVSCARGTGASAIKTYADLDGRLIAAIVAAAHTQHMMVWAHSATFPATPGDVIAAGVDVVSHVSMLAYEVTDDIRPGSFKEHRDTTAAMHDRALLAPPDAIDPLLNEMRTRGTILDATASLSGRGLLEHGEDRIRAAVAVCTWIASRAHQAGVPISAGTDFETPSEEPYPSLHVELEFLVDEVGMAPADAIRSATSVGARAMGCRDTMGTVEPGKLANLVVVRADPQQNIGALRTVEMTVKRGRRLLRSDFDAEHDAVQVARA